MWLAAGTLQLVVNGEGKIMWLLDNENKEQILVVCGVLGIIAALLIDFGAFN